MIAILAWRETEQSKKRSPFIHHTANPVQRAEPSSPDFLVEREQDDSRKVH